MAGFVVLQAQQEGRHHAGLESHHGHAVIVHADIDGLGGHVDHFFRHFVTFLAALPDSSEQLAHGPDQRASGMGIHDHGGRLLALLECQLNVVAFERDGNSCHERPRLSQLPIWGAPASRERQRPWYDRCASSPRGEAHPGKPAAVRAVIRQVPLPEDPPVRRRVDPTVPVPAVSGTPVLPAPAEPAPDIMVPAMPASAACWMRRLFCTWVMPETDSARSSAWRFSKRLFTVPVSVTSRPSTRTSISEASICGS